MSRGFAAALMQSGFMRQEIVGVILPNIPEYASILFGIWDAGYDIRLLIYYCVSVFVYSIPFFTNYIKPQVSRISL